MPSPLEMLRRPFVAPPAGFIPDMEKRGCPAKAAGGPSPLVLPARALGLVLATLIACAPVLAAPAPKGAPRPAPKAAPTSKAAPAEDDSIPKPNPTVFLIVEGSAENAVIWRGWPVIVQGLRPAGQALPQTLQVRGPSPVTPQRASLIWVIPAEASAKLAVGSYRFTAGPLETTAMVADPPASLTPKQVRVQRRISVYAAIALGDYETAKRVATEWTQAEHASVDAFAALGDALAAAGDRAGAARAYCDAINRERGDQHPNGWLHQRAREMLFGTPGPSAAPASR